MMKMGASNFLPGIWSETEERLCGSGSNSVVEDEDSEDEPDPVDVVGTPN
jgi:hypothetical protein